MRYLDLFGIVIITNPARKINRNWGILTFSLLLVAVLTVIRHGICHSERSAAIVGASIARPGILPGKMPCRRHNIDFFADCHSERSAAELKNPFPEKSLPLWGRWQKSLIFDGRGIRAATLQIWQRIRLSKALAVSKSWRCSSSGVISRIPLLPRSARPPSPREKV